MATLSYTVIASLDGYVNDTSGGFEWAAPDEKVHQFVNDLERGVGTYLYGRRLYETMRVWASPEMANDEERVIRDYAAIWRAADKIVYSSTLPEVTTPRTSLERRFEPASVAALKASASRSLSIGGPSLAAHALRAGLVDELCWLVVPTVVGGGTRMLPDGLRLDLELVESRRFDGGTHFLRYRIR